MALPAPNPSALAHNRQMLERSGGGTRYTAAFGLELLEHGHGLARFRLPGAGPSLDESLAVASGVLLSLVDHVGAIAAWMTSELGNPRYFGSTVKSAVEVIGPAREDVMVEGRAIAVQGELIFADVLITTGDGDLVAKGSTIYRIIDRGEPEA
jgi:acyl-coenzyme A thioesterase PaaI-like protein